MKLYSYETLMRADYDENAQMSPSNDNNLMYRNFIVASASTMPKNNSIVWFATCPH